MQQLGQDAENDNTSGARNPFRREEDAFRILAMIVGAAAAVIATSLLIGPVAGALLGLVLAAWGGVRAWRWLRAGLSDPEA